MTTTTGSFSDAPTGYVYIYQCRLCGFTFDVERIDAYDVASILAGEGAGCPTGWAFKKCTQKIEHEPEGIGQPIKITKCHGVADLVGGRRA